jgi:hypothetical protein
MIRLPGWEDHLADYLAQHNGAVFKFGKLDCALFAAGGIKAMTGTDPARGLRGKYRSQASSVRALKEHGFDSLAALAGSALDEIPPAFAHRGDIVMDGSDSLGICVGSEALFVGDEDGAPGLVRLPLASWARAWRVPYSG